MADLNKMVEIAIGLMVITIVAYLATGVSEKVATELPVNETGEFASVTTGAEILDTNMSILSITILIIIIAVGIGAVKGLNKKD